MEPEIRNQARKFVFAALKTNTPTDEELREAVDNVLPLVSKLNGVEIDADEFVRTMQAEFNTFQAESVSLDNADGHVEWLPDRRDSIQWGFWERYSGTFRRRYASLRLSFSDWTPRLSASSGSSKIPTGPARGIGEGWS